MKEREGGLAERLFVFTHLDPQLIPPLILSVCPSACPSLFQLSLQSLTYDPGSPSASTLMIQAPRNVTADAVFPRGPSVRPSVCPSVCPLVCLSACPPVCLRVCGRQRRNGGICFLPELQNNVLEGEEGVRKGGCRLILFLS